MHGEAARRAAFDGNEWFVIGMIAIGAIAALLAPKRFTPTQSWFNLMFGVVFGLMFDHTIARPPFDLYDVGDLPEYEWFEIFAYAMYAPFGYFFIYIHQRLRVRGFAVIPYIAAWTAVGIAIEWFGVLVGLFHYKDGYRMLYSVPIYAYVMSLHLLVYRTVFVNDAHASRSA